MSFQYAENILSSELLDMLKSKYCNMDNHDEVHWFLKARYRSEIEEGEKLLIIDHLLNNKESPFYKDRRLLTKRQIHVNKLGVNGALPPHTDTVCGSLTVFLNEQWDEQDGGLFVWTDNDGKQHTVTPKYNCGVWDKWDIPTTGSLHEVTVCQKPRYSLQIFYGIGNNKINIGVTPEDVDLAKYAKDVY